ncbi:hypothetical protein ABZ832_26055 [Streptantibioticus parmotrematis]|uniref:hypothetical protein n=1 Tax=Streptantibioticus parmotrematis TaxID=2873249 RepID=UPI0033F99E3C
MNDWAPVVGQPVKDTAHDRVGEFRAFEQGRVFLRPLGGGREWTTSPDDIEQMSRSEILNARVAAANRRSRKESPA